MHKQLFEKSKLLKNRHSKKVSDSDNKQNSSDIINKINIKKQKKIQGMVQQLPQQPNQFAQSDAGMFCPILDELCN